MPRRASARCSSPGSTSPCSSRSWSISCAAPSASSSASAPSGCARRWPPGRGRARRPRRSRAQLDARRRQPAGAHRPAAGGPSATAERERERTCCAGGGWPPTASASDARLLAEHEFAAARDALRAEVIEEAVRQATAIIRDAIRPDDQERLVRDFVERTAVTAMTGRLAKRYARALLDLARAGDTLEPCAERARPRRRRVRGAAAAAASCSARRSMRRSARGDRARGGRGAGAARPDGAQPDSAARRAGSPGASCPRSRRWYDELLDDGRGPGARHDPVGGGAGRGREDRAGELARRLTRAARSSPPRRSIRSSSGASSSTSRGTIYDGSLRAQLARLSKEMAEDGA